MKRLAVLGSTGSIGQSTLEIVRRHPDRFKVVGLAAGRNIRLLKKQIEEFNPAVVSVCLEEDRAALKKQLSGGPILTYGEDGANSVAGAEGADLVVSAFSGAAGLRPTLTAIGAGKDVAIANKEVLVMAGSLVMAEVREKGIRLLPIDSEHSAIFQSMEGHRREDIRSLLLTASGGPFLNTPLKRLSSVTPEEALAHPNWDMGNKVTIDSATLMNKGLEVIEARWLFTMEPECIKVFIHPQSVIHSMVEYIDGSIMAQMGTPDMKGPISYALSYPERIDSGAPPLDLITLKSLEFFEPDMKRFPCLNLAFAALEEGKAMPAALNAADEVAVEAFLKKRIPFTVIPELIESVMSEHSPHNEYDLDGIVEIDRWAHRRANELLDKYDKLI